MDLEANKYFRFIIPGAIFIGSIFFVIIDRIDIDVSMMKEIKTINSLLLLLSMFSIIAGIPINWMYYVFWHMIIEKGKVQRQEVEWLLGEIKPSQDIFYYSNKIWHYMDINENKKRAVDWLRRNFLIIHSLGSSMFAIFLGTLLLLIYEIYKIIVNDYQFFILNQILLAGWWLFMFIVILIYRQYLMKRYKERLKIFIQDNSEEISGKNQYE